MPPARRNQAERREATRTRVLDATIECLLEDGYANTSTRQIAKRAGVTIGALQHHFAGKAGLMAEAMRALGDRLTADFVSDAAHVEDPGDLIPRLLDRVWDAHRSPLFVSGLELVVAARTDPALRGPVDGAARTLSIHIAEGMLAAFPDLVAAPGFAENVLVGLATLRGLALMGLEEGVDADHLWSIAKPQMLRALAGVLAADSPYLPNES